MCPQTNISNYNESALQELILTSLASNLSLVLIYVLKEIIDRYRHLNGCLFMIFLDASKTFDRVKHSLLFRKLVKCGAPGYIVRILVYWYSHQTMCVRWAGALSSKFSVTNGVRQGGILSPYLFNVYMDDLSGALNLCQSGCISGNSVINHVVYTDDLVVFCPLAAVMSKLLKACEDYGLDHDIQI